MTNIEPMSTSQSTLQSLKQFVPAPLKRAAKEVHSNRKLRRAIASLAKLPAGEIPTAEMLIDLQNAWDNDGFAARMRVRGASTRRCLSGYGPIWTGEKSFGKFMPAPEFSLDLPCRCRLSSRTSAPLAMRRRRRREQVFHAAVLFV